MTDFFNNDVAENIAAVDRLLNALLKPMFVYRMARSTAMYGDPKLRQTRSAIVRTKNAVNEIEKIVDTWCRGEL